MIAFSSLALVACSGGSSQSGVDAPVAPGANGAGGASGACEKNPYGECYPTVDLGTNKAAFGSSSGTRRTAGSTMRNYKWFGYKGGAFVRDADNPDTPLKLLSLADLYDPKGTLGYKVIHLVASSRWCSVCAKETKDSLVKNHAADQGKGVVVFQTMIDGLRQGNPANSKDIDAWAIANGIFVPGASATQGEMLFALVLDPDNKNFGTFFDGAGVPWNGWLDARTMEIIDYAVGFNPSGDDAALKYVGANPPKGQ
jgi:hypothetical protein